MKRPSGHASVEEHPKHSGKYRVRQRIGGKLKTLASGLTEAAANELADAVGKVRNVSEVREGVTLEQFGQGFLDRRERAGVRGIRTDRFYWGKHVARDEIGGFVVADLERRDIVEWLDRRKGLAHRTRIKLLNLLRAALNDAVERELLKASPAREVKVHRAGSATVKDELDGILNPDEQRRLIAAVPAGERPLVVFALCTGIRQAEQWWLRWEDVLADRIIVRRSTGGKAPKAGRPREVFLLPPAKAALASLNRRRGQPLVFPGARGARRQEGKQPLLWKRWVKAAGISKPIRWHDLRHTCATSLLAGWWGRKWSLDEVSKMLGHGTTQVTERYARKLNETLRLAVSETPMTEFPSGNSGGRKMLLAKGNAGNFVKRRSQVQIQQSAPALSAGAGEQGGNSDGAQSLYWLGVGAP